MSSPLVLLTDPIDEMVAADLRAFARAVVARPEVPLHEQVGDAHAIIVRRPIAEDVLEAAPNLLILARHGVGVDILPLEEATERGIAVINAPAANAQSVTEHAIALMLSLTRSIRIGDQAVRAGEWIARDHLMPTELSGKRLLLLGIGEIGRRVARVGLAMGLEIVALDQQALEIPGIEVRPPSELHRSLAEADVISLHLPLTPATRKILGPREFACVREGAILINTARGELIDEAALLTALRDGRIAAAGLDVFDDEPVPLGHPLTLLDNVVLTPHLAYKSRESLRRTGESVIGGLRELFEGTQPANLVNKSVWLAFQKRLASHGLSPIS